MKLLMIAASLLAIPASASATVYNCKSTLLSNGVPYMGISNNVMSIKTHQGISEISLQDGKGNWRQPFATSDLNHPVPGDGKGSRYSTYRTTYTRKDGVKVLTYEASGTVVVESVLFRSLCETKK